MSRRNVVATLLGIVSLCLLYGCSSKEAMEISERVKDWNMLKKKPPNATYVVDAPGSIRVEFLSPLPAPQPAQVLLLRQDGKITLPYLEDVDVGHKTTLEIRAQLEDLYSKYYKEPKILVSVVGYASKHLYVYGEVGRQGSIPYTGHMTVSDVMGIVGGVTTRAAYWRCKVIRGDPDHPETTMVNFRRIMLEGDLRQDVELAENDVLRVPPTAFAWIGYQIDDLTFPFRSILGAVGTVGAVRAAPTNVTGFPGSATGATGF